jgi:hypothetical protein
MAWRFSTNSRMLFWLVSTRAAPSGLRWSLRARLFMANKPLVPTRNGEAPLLAAQRRR